MCQSCRRREASVALPRVVPRRGMGVRKFSFGCGMWIWIAW